MTVKKQPRRPARISLLLVDDHPMWRRTVKNVIEEAAIGKVTAEASTAAEAIAAASRAKPDVVLMDMALPDSTGAEITRELKELLPETKVLVLSASDSRADVAAAMSSGAHGYLLKTAEPDQVADAIVRVHRGELVFPAELTEMVLAQLAVSPSSNKPIGGDPANPLNRLTEREREVLALMAEGRTNQAISNKLYLTPKTVEAHVRSVFTKLGLELTADDHRRVLAVITYLRSLADEHAGG